MVWEMSARGNILVGKCPVGKIFSSRKYRSGICPEGSVSWGAVPLGN